MVIYGNHITLLLGAYFYTFLFGIKSVVVGHGYALLFLGLGMSFERVEAEVKVGPLLVSNLPRIINPQLDDYSLLIVSNIHHDQACAIGPLPMRLIGRLKTAAA